MVPPAIAAVLFPVVAEDGSEPKLVVAKEVLVDVGSISAAVALAIVDDEESVV
jgi:hypothetical protein